MTVPILLTLYKYRTVLYVFNVFLHIFLKTQYKYHFALHKILYQSYYLFPTIFLSYGTECTYTYIHNFRYQYNTPFFCNTIILLYFNNVKQIHIYIFNNQILLYIYNLITKNAIPMSIHYCFQQYGLPFVLTSEDQLFHLTLPG